MNPPSFGRIFAAIQPEWAEEDGVVDFDESTALYDDGFWHRVAFRLPFSWQWYLNWWASRRYVMPRDVRRR